MVRPPAEDPAALRLDKRTARAVQDGHPWIWGDVFAGLRRRPEPGAEWLIEDPLGNPMGRALVDEAGGGPALRVLTLDPRDPPLRKLLFRRVAAARRLRERVVPAGTDAFRLLHGEGDALPGLVADRYGPVLVLRPDTSAWEPHLGDVVEALRSEGGSGITSFVLRRKQPGEAQERVLLAGSVPPDELGVTEDGRRYLVRPAFGQKTGFFLDQRPNRSHIQSLARSGDRALNLFSYTGGFSVALALGGAANVVSVDVSASILDDCQRQFPLNGLDPAPHEFVAADAFQWLPARARELSHGHVARPFDIVVCDPPALAHSKDALPAARRASVDLHRALAPLLSRGGLLLTCSCTSRMDGEELLADARTGLRLAGRELRRVLRLGGAGEDHPVAAGFPEGRYLHCLTLQVD
jgi:23S rRNA (cytosine1962-C5)-methyltransferase